MFSRREEKQGDVEKPRNMENQINSHLKVIADLECKCQFERAIDKVILALNEEPENADLHYKYAQLLQTANRDDEVIAQLEKAVFFDPFHSKAQNDLGVRYYHDGEYDKALEHLKKAASLDGSLAVHQNLGRLLAELGRYDEAMAEFEKVILCVPTTAEGQVGMSNQVAKPPGSPVEEPVGQTDAIAVQDRPNRRRGSDNDTAGEIHKYCSVCGSAKNSFLPLPKHYIENMYHHRFKQMGRGEMTSIDQYACSNCGASDRQRLYAVWFDHEASIGRFNRRGKLIHFAPEQPLFKKIRSMNIFSEILTADIGMSGVDCRVDLMSLPFPAESFDMFICSHILEHVDDDDLALSELHRVLKMGGRGILMAPIMIGIKRTIEGTHHESVEERWGLFGQDDHVRLYAHDDFVSKVSHHGFHLLELGMDYFGEKLFERLGLLETSILYIVEKW